MVLDCFRKEVGQDSFVKIRMVDSVDILEARIKELQKPQAASTTRDNADIVDSLLARLRPVCGVAVALAPASPEIGAAILGSVWMIATVGFLT